jgi:hypothetical protein
MIKVFSFVDLGRKMRRFLRPGFTSGPIVDLDSKRKSQNPNSSLQMK